MAIVYVSFSDDFTVVWFLFFKSMVFTLQKYGFCFLNVVLLQSVSNIIGRLSAAVGADLSRPHIGIHPQNDERKHVCGEMDMCICLCQNTGAMNRPLRLAECFVVISWVNVGCLQSVSWLFRGCSLHY